MVTIFDDRLISIRDRAVLLVGLSGVLRRSQITDLNVEDVKFDSDCLNVVVRSVTNAQPGQIHVIHIRKGINEDTCPVRALQTWLEAPSLKWGPVPCH